jgi:2-succinyl-5-enolpyruvyl-6-hydroxy-3-cyclohexene-1-carboxylate synthase
MVHHLQHIADLVEICRQKGISQLVVSPGSRNAPLVNLFKANRFFKLHSIVDERVAGFYALGISLACNEPVMLLCTSGTAVLNYAPALAEAYYRHVPLIALTADRPGYLIDQQDNQTIRQSNIFANYIKESISLHTPLTDTYELQTQHYAIDKTINLAVSGIKGPVHINVPIEEPLYSKAPKSLSNIKCNEKTSTVISGVDLLKQKWVDSNRTIILCGQNALNDEISKTVLNLANNKKAVVLAEPISNIRGDNIHSAIDRILMQIESEKSGIYKPQLLISLGGAVVSKRLKQWLQKFTDLDHIRLSYEEDKIDTYKNLKTNITGDVPGLLKTLVESPTKNNKQYCKLWENASMSSFKKHIEFLKDAPFSDLSVFHHLLKNLPENIVLHLGNSTPVRYAQLFQLNHFKGVFANRGVSGIDGCVSTAAGYASQSNLSNVLIVGDLSFIYDSNALWNKNLPENLKIVVINNKGGGIFRLLPGADKTNGFDEFIETNHYANIEKLADAFGLTFFKGKPGIVELTATFKKFLKHSGAAIFETETPKDINPGVYQSYIEKIKSNNC